MFYIIEAISRIIKVIVVSVSL